MTDSLPPIKLPDKRSNIQANHRHQAQAAPQLDDSTAVLLRVLVGAVFAGTDEIVQKASEVQAQARQQLQNPNIVSDEDTTNPMDRFRYFAIGLLFEARDQIDHQMKQLDSRWNRTQSSMKQVFAPWANSRLFAPIKQRFDSFFDDLSNSIEATIERGKQETIIGKESAVELADDVVDTLLDYLAHNPEVMQMVQRQSSDFISGLLNETRYVASSADNQIETLARHLTGRRRRSELQPKNRTNIISPDSL